MVHDSSDIIISLFFGKNSQILFIYFFKRETIFSSLFSVQQSIHVTAQITGFSIWKGSGMFSLTILETFSEKLSAF